MKMFRNEEGNPEAGGNDDSWIGLLIRVGTHHGIGSIDSIQSSTNVILPPFQLHKKRLTRHHHVGVSERSILKTGGLTGHIGHIAYNYKHQEHEDLTPPSDSFFLDV